MLVYFEAIILGILAWLFCAIVLKVSVFTPCQKAVAFNDPELIPKMFSDRYIQRRISKEFWLDTVKYEVIDAFNPYVFPVIAFVFMMLFWISAGQLFILALIQIVDCLN